MSVKEYTFIDPLDGNLGDALREWLRRRTSRASRLISALEEFVERDLDLSSLATERKRDGREIYLEPPRYVLAHMPDAACLIRVDHVPRTIEVVHLKEEYGGIGESQQWNQIRIIAARYL
jgi:hypothetical protein